MYRQDFYQEDGKMEKVGVRSELVMKTSINIFFLKGSIN